MIELIKKLNEGVYKNTKNVLVVGDVMIDEYFFGNVERISPEAPVPIVKEEKIEWSLGGAANVAANCKKIGLNVDLVGLIGMADDKGKKLISLLEEKEILSSGLVRTDKRGTICKKRVMAANHQLLRLDSENISPLCRAEESQVIENITRSIKQDSIILISDYAKGVITPAILFEIKNLADSKNCLILVDPKGSDYGKYKGVNYLKPNLKEFSELIKFFRLNKEDSLIDNGVKICKFLGLDGLIVTLGEKGIQFVSPTESIFIPAHKREVYDLTGAGDTVFAFLALGLNNNFTMEQSLKVANLAACVAVTHLKTYAVGLDDLIKIYANFSDKIFHDWAALKEKLDELKAKNKKIVFTNGSFDLIHAGHIFSLQEAKKQGDVLVVALNTDDSVKRYKGLTRPINSLNDREKVMEAFRVVDYVVSFDQDTPRELIAYLKPDVLVKGGDYKAEKIAGYDIVASYGGSVFIVDYQEGYSTTNLVKSIKTKIDFKRKQL